MLENQEVDNTFQVKKFAPNLPLLIGNLGAVQLNYGADSRKIRDIIERTQCDAFNFHLNPLQEAIQAEGDRNFSNLIPKLKECIADLPVPILIKEVGAGISRTTAKKLKGLQIAGIETAGTGGTSWAKIEGLRRKDESGQNLGDLFARWGIPTVESLIICREEFPNLTIVASGGVRNGIEVAKAIALGADAVAMALPFLKEAEKSVEHAISAIQSVILELRTTLFVTGMSDLKELKVKGRSLLRRERDATG
jgi:isopentenyl-diphosphate delta-isomerase